MNGAWIQTVSGKAISLENPDPDLIDIDDIAHALSNIGRFTGHTRQFYSTAQHSVLVASIMPPELQMWGLCHDMPEAYLGDVSSPLKSVLPGYRRLEKIWQEMIYVKFGIMWLSPPRELKEADIIALATEATQLLGNISAWDLPDWAQPLDIQITPWSSRSAKTIFKNCFDIAATGEPLPEYRELAESYFPMERFF